MALIKYNTVGSIDSYYDIMKSADVKQKRKEIRLK